MTKSLRKFIESNHIFRFFMGVFLKSFTFIAHFNYVRKKTSTFLYILSILSSYDNWYCKHKTDTAMNNIFQELD